MLAERQNLNEMLEIRARSLAFVDSLIQAADSHCAGCLTRNHLFGISTELVPEPRQSQPALVPAADGTGVDRTEQDFAGRSGRVR